MMPEIHYRIAPFAGKDQHGEARKLLRQLLAEILPEAAGAEVEHDKEGRPYLAGFEYINISISHCRKAVAVAVSNKVRVGIDVECRRKISDGLALRVCTDEERGRIEISSDAVMEFLSLWTQKEAVLKCRGTGIKGFGSMETALEGKDCKVRNLDTGDADLAAALAWSE